MELYNDRISQIQDVSNVLTEANHQLGEILKKLGWSRSSSIYKEDSERCKIDGTHLIKKKNDQHNQLCLLNKLGMKQAKYKDFPTSPSFAYMNSSVVVPVTLEVDNYKRHGISFDIQFKDSKKVEDDVQAVNDTVIEHNTDVNNFLPTDCLDELRFIYSWDLIPSKYKCIDFEAVPVNVLQEWIRENLPSKFNSGFFVRTILKQIESHKTNPDNLYKSLYPLLGHLAKEFVLSLWIFVSAKAHCYRNNISEHTRKEFDVYSLSKTKSSKLKDSVVENESPFTLGNIPYEWTNSKMTREQKLAIYEEVCMIGKSLRRPLLQFTDLETDAEQQMKVLMSLEEKKGEKTHLELLAEMRDYKRRRQSYRGKNKSNVKLTPTEVLREIVEQHMLYYDIINKKSTNNKNDVIEKRNTIGESDEGLKSDVITKNEDGKPMDREEYGRSTRRRSKSRDRREQERKKQSRDRGGRERRSRSRDRRNRSRERRSRSRDRQSKHRSKISRYHESHSRSHSSEHLNKNKRVPPEISNVTFYN